MKFLVIGDLMIDRYIIGKVNRISPEAPVPIVDVKYQYDVLGGASNCAKNISAITGEGTVDIAGAFGQDEAGEVVQKLLKKDGIKLWYMSNDHPTTIKERVFADNQQLIRLDLEDTNEIPFYHEKTHHIALTHEILNEYDMIIVSDYAKGVVSKKLMDWIGVYKDKIIIDPKPENSHLYPEGVLLYTPNEREYNQIVLRGVELPQYILITKGDKGSTLMKRTVSGLDVVEHIKAEEIEKGEVIGAGDTITAIMAICLQRGVDMLRSSKIANKCAAYVVSQKGTATVPKNVFEDIFIKESL